MQPSDLNNSREFPPLTSEQLYQKSGLRHVRRGVYKQARRDAPTAVVSKEALERVAEQNKELSERFCKTRQTISSLRDRKAYYLTSGEGAQDKLEEVLREIDSLYDLIHPEKVKAPKEKINLPPHLQPNSEELSAKYLEIYQRTMSIQEKISDSKTTVSDKEASAELAPYKREFVLLLEKMRPLEEPILKKLRHLEKQVKDQRETVIPKEHVESIARYEKTEVAEVEKNLAREKKLMEDRMARHDALASTFVQMKVRSELIGWEVESVQIYADLQYQLKNTVDALAALEKRMTVLKRLIREHGMVQKKDRTEEHQKAVEDYNKFSAMAASIKPTVEEILERLKRRQSLFVPDAHKQELMKQVTIWNTELKERTEKEAFQKSHIIQTESDAKRASIAEVWQTIYKLVNEQLPLDIDRVGVALKDKDGSIPYVKGFRTRYSTRFVKTPFSEA